MLNRQLNEKFEIFHEIDKFTSNENVKENILKNKDPYLFDESNNISTNQASNFMNNNNYFKYINNNENNNKTFKKSKNIKITNLKEQFPNNNNQIVKSEEKRKEENPEKFVLHFFYDEQNAPIKSNKKYNNSTFNQKNNLNNNEFKPNKVKYYRQNKYCSKDKQNLTYTDINRQLMNYQFMLTRVNYNTYRENNAKSKDNNCKTKKIIKKLYIEGMKNKQKREIIYEENLKKKNEEYKKYPYHPNLTKTTKSKKNKCIKLKNLNDKFYTKQVEWKNKKDEENFQKKKFKEEAYLSQFSFKPIINQEFMADDEEMINRNSNDMNKYILKRRNQIRYKKEDGFKLRDYKDTNINIENNKYKDVLTERVYYRNKNGLNGPFIATTKQKYNYTKLDFLRAVKNLHNEIRNLNI